MANAFATNYPIPATNNSFQLLWKLTRVMKAAGWVTTASSDGYVRDATGSQGTSQTSSIAASSDKWGTNVNPLNDTYPGTYLSDTAPAWIVMSGPKTVKISLNANPTGIFIKGETVTQTTSTAEGELLGYVWDTVGLTGYAVIMPHSGNFDNSHTVTGSLSSATFVPTGTVAVYGREILFSKPLTSTVNGNILYICADVVAEASQFFSAIAATISLPATTIAAGSNGQVLLPSITANITVASTTGFTSTGQILVTGSNGPQLVTYTGITATTFTGCLLGNSTLSIGGAITGLPTVAPGLLGTTITSGSNSIALPQATINVSSTAGFAATGTFTLNLGTGNWQTIAYTGLTTTTFTGCTGGTGTMLTGQVVSQNFPLRGVCIRGNLTGTSSAWFSNNTATFMTTNNGQIACVNATPSTAVTADGSFYALATMNIIGVNNACGLMYTRLDDTEAGDVDPYVFVLQMTESMISWTNTSSTSTYIQNYLTPSNFFSSSSNGPGCFIGYAARGCPVASRDLQSVWSAGLYTAQITGNAGYVLLGGFSSSGTIPFRYINHPSTTPPSIREQFLVLNNGVTAMGSNAQIKGKTRWINVVANGQSYDTYENKTWIAVSGVTTGSPVILFGPYDGITTPTI